ncbi:11065_t:CDS:2 [Racocetra fulgida]|uniref:11065_t:CDS:1 n=1 Tax=Racocetra fulgida TaxID=60492 RepID=A0A9N8VHC6_9GLOM|nr:11065_t:CDS:2 [Racocetra fulgida]
MLIPKQNPKYRYPHLVKYEGKAKGEFGLQAQQGSYISNKQIEASHKVIRKFLKKFKAGQVKTNIFPHLAKTKKPLEVLAVAKQLTVIFEVKGLPKDVAYQALTAASYKLPVQCKVKEQIFCIDYQKNTKKGDEIVFDKILNRDNEFGQPYLTNVRLIGEVLKHGLNKKIVVMKYKPKKRYKKKMGHRQQYTEDMTFLFKLFGGIKTLSYVFDFLEKVDYLPVHQVKNLKNKVYQKNKQIEGLIYKTGRGGGRQDQVRAQGHQKIRKKITLLIQQEGGISEKVLFLAREHGFPKEKVNQI